MRFPVRVLAARILTVAAMWMAVGCVGRLERPPVPGVVSPPDKKTGTYTLENYSRDLQNYDSATDAEKIPLRNKMVYGIMAEIDYVFYDYETKLYLNQGRFEVGADATQLGLAAASTITNGARSKTVLSAVLSGVTGVNLSIDKNFFRQQTVQAISSSMEANRDRIKNIILQQLKQDAIVYPFSAARADLIKYFFAGTLPSGLQQLHQQAAASAQSQQANLNQTQLKMQLTGISEQQVNCATGVNQAFAAAKMKGDFTAVLKFLDAMGSPIDPSLPKDKIEEKAELSIRELGEKAVTDEAVRKKYCEEAQKAQLLQAPPAKDKKDNEKKDK